MKSLRWFLGISVLANLVLAFLYWRQPEAHAHPTASTTASLPTLASPPKLQLENDQFDFSQTSLSDEAWKIEAPDLQPEPGTSAPD